MTRRIYSEAHPVAPRADRSLPLVCERTFDDVPDVVLDELQKTAESAQRLPRPFQQVVEVTRTSGRLEVTLERFCGVTGPQLVAGLLPNRRLLPLDVWLAVADAWLAAIASIPEPNAPASHTAWTHGHVGVDLTGALTFNTDEPDHVMGHWPPPMEEGGVRILGQPLPATLSPETLANRPPTAATHVYCVGVALICLLTLDQPFADSSEVAMFHRIREGSPRWASSRHPECVPALRAVLEKAIRPLPQQRWPSADAFRAALRDAAPVQPASPPRVAGAFFGARPDVMQQVFDHVAAHPALWPEAWRDGALQVMQDRLLEHQVAGGDFPPDLGRPEAVAVAEAPAALRAKTSWWRRLLGA